jgi:membrane protease YdiL (CAAX protease family)
MSLRDRELVLSRGIVTTFWFFFGIACAVALTPSVFELSIRLGFDFDFLRVFRRLLLLAAVLVIAFRLKPWRDGNFSSYGLQISRDHASLLVMPYLITIAAISFLLTVEMSAGWLSWNLRDDFASRAARYFLSGFVVAFLEEVFFRGWMTRRIESSKGIVAAVFWTNLVYAAAHAFNPRHVPMDVPLTWEGALTALALWLRHMVSPTAFGPSVFGLFLFGLLLSILSRRTGSLWPAIGVHAAAVFMLHGLVSSLTGMSRPGWAGTKAMYDGPPGWLLLIVSIGLLLRLRGGVTAKDRAPLPG